jgi:hypothetical protein
MAVMRTNRLTSKTTPPKTRKIVPASELESQDASYKKYKEQDLPAYNEKMKKYETERKRVYGFGGENISRSLNPAELSEYNSRQRQEGGLEYKKVKVDPSYNKKSTDADWMVGTAHRTYDPIKPSAPKKSEPADWSNVELNKMPTKKATIQAPKGKLRQAKPAAEKPVFEAPASTRSKTRTSAAMTGGGKSGLTRATNPKGSLGAAKVTTTVNKAGRGYNKEAKQFAAYANPTASGTYLNTASKPEIMRMRAESKGIQKEYRKEGNKEGAKMMRSEAKQLKTAGKFADKVYEKGGGKYFKGSMVDQYRKSK